MSNGIRNFRRPLGEKRYRKMFVIAAEGSKTEPQYFNQFNQRSIIHVHCLKGEHESAPQQVLKRMREYLREYGLKDYDEAWLVVDMDQWTEEQLAQLYSWSLDADNCWFALSNPMFEYWLLLHFEEGAGIAGARECMARLRRHLPDYDKGIDPRRITQEMIDAAVTRARTRDMPPCDELASRHRHYRLSVGREASAGSRLALDACRPKRIWV